MSRGILVVALVPFLAGCAANAAGAQEPEPAPRTITVNASASVERAADQAAISFAVETEAASAQDASDANAAAMTAVLAALEQSGIDRGAVRTQGLRVLPDYVFPGEGQPRRISGYRAVNQIRVTVNDLALTGRLIERALDAGANRVDGVAFSLSDPDAARIDALGRAVARARAEAAAIADALGEPLGPALSVSTSEAGGPPVLMREARSMEAAPPPVEPGAIEVSATVNVVFRIGRP